VKRAVKAFVFAVALLVAAPLWIAAWLEKALWRGEGVYLTAAQLVALVPGPIGNFLRGAYYRMTLVDCSWETSIGFGSIFTHRGATVRRNVSTGSYCVIGHARIGAGTMFGSRVSVPSGKRQHFGDDGRLSTETRFDTVAIGAGCWVGEGAIVMADVGDRCVISAGAVVTKAVPANSIAGGNPAKVLRALEEAA
jgi:acetyltransferase-like isoleucine patch superfamily enzyme